jgi:hypothetical protein
MGNAFKFILEYNDYIDDIENSEKDQYIYSEILKRTKFGKLSLIEGLIYTYPIEKSIVILKNRFPELVSQVEEDGEIFIENNTPSEIKIYLPLITNIGYFISKLTLDGQEWITEYKNEDKPVAFVLEPKYDYPVEIPSRLYHASPIKFKNKILKSGLTPKSGNKLSLHPDRIYLTDDISKAISFGNYLVKNQDTSEWYDSGYCIYSISGSGLSRLYSDINFREGGFYTLNNIRPQDINLVKEFKNENR